MKNEPTQQQVLKDALSIKKANKQRAFDTIRGLIDNLNEKDYTTPVTGNQLSELYSYFLPPLPAKPRIPEAWVCKAIAGKDEIKDYLKGAYSTGTHLAATDGHRLHVCDTTMYPKGWYNKQMGRLSDFSRPFPDTDRVTPQNTETRLLLLNDLEVRELETNGEIFHVYILDDEGKKSYAVNRKYLLEALAGGDRFTVMNWPLDNMESVKIQGPFPDSYAVIMPMRIG